MAGGMCKSVVNQPTAGPNHCMPTKQHRALACTAPVAHRKSMKSRPGGGAPARLTTPGSASSRAAASSSSSSLQGLYQPEGHVSGKDGCAARSQLAGSSMLRVVPLYTTSQPTPTASWPQAPAQHTAAAALTRWSWTGSACGPHRRPTPAPCCTRPAAAAGAPASPP